MERETVKKKMMEAFHKRPFSEPLDKYRTELQFIEHMTNAAMDMMEDERAVSYYDTDCPRCIDAIRHAGCTCKKPLLGHRPGVGPRCRLCNKESGGAPSEFEIWKEGYKARYAERWGATVARESDLITLYRKWKNERTGNANPSLP